MRFSAFLLTTTFLGVLATGAAAQGAPSSSPSASQFNSFSIPGWDRPVAIATTPDRGQPMTPPSAPVAVTTPPVREPLVNMNAPAPEFTLLRATGGSVSLRDTLMQGPVVILFVNGATFRDNWAGMEMLNKNMRNFQALGIQVLVIAPDNLTTLAGFQKRAQFGFELLSDETYATSTQYGMTQMKTPYPALFSISQDGRMVGLQVRPNNFDLNEAVAPLRRAIVPPPVKAPVSSPVPSAQQKPALVDKRQPVPAHAALIKDKNVIPPPMLQQPQVRPVVPAVPSPQPQIVAPQVTTTPQLVASAPAKPVIPAYSEPLPSPFADRLPRYN